MQVLRLHKEPAINPLKRRHPLLYGHSEPDYLSVLILVVLILGPDNSCLRARGVDSSFVHELIILKVHVMLPKVKSISRKKLA